MSELSFEEYPSKTRVKVISLNVEGEAWERFGSCISVFLDNEDEARYFDTKDIEFLNEKT